MLWVHVERSCIRRKLWICTHAIFTHICSHLRFSSPRHGGNSKPLLHARSQSGLAAMSLLLSLRLYLRYRFAPPEFSSTKFEEMGTSIASITACSFGMLLWLMKMGLFKRAATLDNASPGPAPREPSSRATILLALPGAIYGATCIFTRILLLIQRKCSLCNE